MSQVDDCAAHSLIVQSSVPLAAGGEERTIGHIVRGQRISHKNDVVRAHRDGPQVTLDFLNERRQSGLEGTLHHRLRVTRRGQCTAMKAGSHIYQTFLSLITFFATYPIWSHSSIKSEERRRRKQAAGMTVPLIAVKGGKLPTIRAFSPAQAAMRK